MIASLTEFVLSDIWTENRYPTRTKRLLDNWERKASDVKDNIMNKQRQAVEGLRGCNNDLVNAAVHLKVEFYSSLDDKPETGLVQLTDYSGRSGGSRWRITSAYKGIIGRCLRTGKPEHVNFLSEKEYEARMVKEFGFTSEEMKSHTKSGRSYWAQPIVINHQLVGVLYLFSTEPQVFPRAIYENRIESIAEDVGMLLTTARIL